MSNTHETGGSGQGNSEVNAAVVAVNLVKEQVVQSGIMISPEDQEKYDKLLGKFEQGLKFTVSEQEFLVGLGFTPDFVVDHFPGINAGDQTAGVDLERSEHDGPDFSGNPND
jgi:hypothetical protein